MTSAQLESQMVQSDRAFDCPRPRWAAYWSAYLLESPAWQYSYQGRRQFFKPSDLTVALFQLVTSLADEDGFLEITFAELAGRLSVEESQLWAQVRALRHVGIVERYARPGECNRYRLAVERHLGTLSRELKERAEDQLDRAGAEKQLEAIERRLDAIERATDRAHAEHLEDELERAFDEAITAHAD
jgi:DNA-binding MarR family transcriptional regulator